MKCGRSVTCIRGGEGDRSFAVAAVFAEGDCIRDFGEEEIAFVLHGHAAGRIAFLAYDVATFGVEEVCEVAGGGLDAVGFDVGEVSPSAA